MKEEETKDTLLKDSSLHPHPCLLVEYVRDVNCVLLAVPLRRLEGNALGVVDRQLRESEFGKQHRFLTSPPAT